MPIPSGTHDDWKWPFSLIPWSWTTKESNTPPTQIWGTVPEGQHLDVPKEGQWTVAWPPHWAYTSPEGDINRISLARYTYPDPQGGGGYYQLGSLRLGSVTRFFKELFDMGDGL